MIGATFFCAAGDVAPLPTTVVLNSNYRVHQISSTFMRVFGDVLRVQHGEIDPNARERQDRHPHPRLRLSTSNLYRRTAQAPPHTQAETAVACRVLSTTAVRPLLYLLL